MVEIVLIPTQGFCNRLRAIACTYILSSFLRTRFYINWVPEDCCNCKISDIFKTKFDTIDLNEIRNKKYIFNPRVHTEHYLQSSELINLDYLIIQGGHEFKHPNMSEIEFLKLKHAFYNSLEWVNEINEIVKSYNFSNIVGIHFRDYIKQFDESDGRDFSKISPIEDFEKYVTRLLNNSDYKFFISSNSNKAFSKLSKIIPSDRLYILQDITISRNCPKGIIHAVANFLILSKCVFIIGTVFSSYSDEACFFNMIMKLCIGDEKITKYHCYGYNELYKYNTLLPNFQTLNLLS